MMHFHPRLPRLRRPAARRRIIIAGDNRASSYANNDISHERTAAKDNLSFGDTAEYTFPNALPNIATQQLDSYCRMTRFARTCARLPALSNLPPPINLPPWILPRTIADPATANSRSETRVRVLACARETIDSRARARARRGTLLRDRSLKIARAYSAAFSFSFFPHTPRARALHAGISSVLPSPRGS